MTLSITGSMRTTSSNLLRVICASKVLVCFLFFCLLVVHHTFAWTQERVWDQAGLSSAHHDVETASLMSLCVCPTLNSSLLNMREKNSTRFSIKNCPCPLQQYEHFPALSGNSYRGIRAILFIAASYWSSRSCYIDQHLQAFLTHFQLESSQLFPESIVISS